MTPKELRELEALLTPAERAELQAILEADMADVLWRPFANSPQLMAFNSKADILGYGGAAGGGKTDLLAGLVQDGERHERALVVRREKAQTEGVIQRLQEIVGSTDGFNGQKSIWRIPGGALTEFAGLDNPGDETQVAGPAARPEGVRRGHRDARGAGAIHPRLARTSNPKLRARALLTFNPPTTTEGRWVIDFFGPWLDKKHPLFPKRLACCAGARCCPTTAADPRTSMARWPRAVRARRRRAVLRVRPGNASARGHHHPRIALVHPGAPDRQPLLHGDGLHERASTTPRAPAIADAEWRLRCRHRGRRVAADPHGLGRARAGALEAARNPKGEMLSIGVDVARGGKDNTVIANRHQADDNPWWFDEAKVYPGTETPDGPVVAGLTIAVRRDNAPVHIDVIGVGSSPYDVLNGMGVQVIGVNVSEKAVAHDKSGRLSFFNLRSYLWWRFRELLDPANDTGIALPPDKTLAKELAAPKWSVAGYVVKVQSREEIIATLGFSPDRATAYILASMDTGKLSTFRSDRARADVLGYDPHARLGT
jgi:hypothetical protein